MFVLLNSGVAYGLTESIDLFGQSNSADIILNDLWIEPKNPYNGETISIHGSVYNAGIVSTGQITDVVTIGYFVNGDLVEITLLDNIKPGLENGIEISSGPVFDAIPGKYIITGIINYHDTLSHLRDNPENNIVQRIIQIGNETPSIIDFNVFQKYNKDITSQEITIKGKITDIFQRNLSNQDITIEIEGIVQEKIITDREGSFSSEFIIPHNKEIIEISAHSDNNSLLSLPVQQILPIQVNENEAVLSLSYQEYKNTPLTVIIFQDSYDNLYKKITTNQNTFNIFNENIIPIILPSEHEYIFEVYFEGKFVDAFQRYFEENQVIKKEIPIRESAQIQFRVIDEFGEPQNNVKVSNWIYSDITNENGTTNWIKIFPTFSSKEPYIAKAVFPDGIVVWSEKFQIEEGEKKVIQIIKKGEIK